MVLLAVGPNEPLAVGQTYEVQWLVDRKMVSIQPLLLGQELTV